VAVPSWFSHIYFIVGGLALVCIGIALLTDFRGFGKVWDEGLNRQAAYIGKLARFPWPHNPYLGPTYRPAVGVFALVVGATVVLLNLISLGR
jgi:hypothetical protein